MAFEPVHRRHRGRLHQRLGRLDQRRTHRRLDLPGHPRHRVDMTGADTAPAARASCSAGIDAHTSPRAATVRVSRDERRPSPATTDSSTRPASVASNASSHERTSTTPGRAVRWQDPIGTRRIGHAQRGDRCDDRVLVHASSVSYVRSIVNKKFCVMAERAIRRTRPPAQPPTPSRASSNHHDAAGSRIAERRPQVSNCTAARASTCGAIRSAMSARCRGWSR